MRSETDRFTVNGRPMLAPDGPVSVTYTDLDGPDAGRDLNGILHRSVVRYKLAAWEFTYSNLSDAEKQYLEGLFPDAPTFSFGHPARQDAAQTEVTQCYRSRCALAWRNARTGLWSELKFQIIEV